MHLTSNYSVCMAAQLNGFIVLFRRVHSKFITTNSFLFFFGRSALNILLFLSRSRARTRMNKKESKEESKRKETHWLLRMKVTQLNIIIFAYRHAMHLLPCIPSEVLTSSISTLPSKWNGKMWKPQIFRLKCAWNPLGCGHNIYIFLYKRFFFLLREDHNTLDSHRLETYEMTLLDGIIHEQSEKFPFFLLWINFFAFFPFRDSFVSCVEERIFFIFFVVVVVVIVTMKNFCEWNNVDEIETFELVFLNWKSFFPLNFGWIMTGVRRGGEDRMVTGGNYVQI